MSNQVYKKGQIVWAKVRGFPWWPAVVNESNKKKNVVDKNVSLFFLAENTIGSVPVHKLLDYEANFEQLSGTKNKKLQEAVKIACDSYGDPRKKKNASDTSENASEAQMVGEVQDEKQKDIVRQDNSISKITEEDPNQVKDEEINKQRKTEAKGKKEEGSKFEQKQKMKRDAKNFKFTGSIDMLKKRSTRSQSRNDNLEVFTEPLIYFSKKSNRNDSEGYSDEEFDYEDGEREQGQKFQSNLGKRCLEDDDDNGFYHANNNAQEEINRKNSNRGRKKVKTQDTATEKKNQKNKENLNKEQRNSISELLRKGSNLRELNRSKGYQNQNQSTKYVGPVRSSSPYNNTFYHSSSLIAQNSFNNIKAILNGPNQSSNKHLRNFDLAKIEIVTPLQTNDTYNLRKNVCQKLASMLQEGYPIDKDSAQELTLFVEGRINSYFGNDADYYKKIMKILYKLIKVKAITVEELRDIIIIDFEEFQILLQNKVQDALSLKKVKPLIEPELTQHSVNNSTESPNTSNNTPPEDLILENIEIPIVAENIIQESSLPEPISESSEEKALKEDEQYQEILKSREQFEKDLEDNIKDQELIRESAEIVERESIRETIQEHEDVLKGAEKFEEEYFQEDLQNQRINLESEEKVIQDDEDILKSDERIEEEYSKEEAENDKNILEDDERIEEDIPKEAFHEIAFNDGENIEEKALSL